MAKPQRVPFMCGEGHPSPGVVDCRTCQACAAVKKSGSGPLPKLSEPATRALAQAGITTLAHLANYTELEVLAFHGVGPTTVPKLRVALKAVGLRFKIK